MAPMVDLSHVAYRELVRGFGGCDLFYSEMLNSRIVPKEDLSTSAYLQWACLDDLIFQIVGNDFSAMQAAIKRLDALHPRGIDINMGCSLKKIRAHGWGASLMTDPGVAKVLVSGFRKATDGPLSVKMRIGDTPDMAYLLGFASMLEACGVDFLVLHARTSKEGMSRRARWEYIAALKAHLSIPVIGNGGINGPGDVLEMFKKTGCDGVMIGRQAIVTPWIFRDTKALMAGEPAPVRPDIMGVTLDLISLLEKYFTPDIAWKRFKTAFTWLSKNLVYGHYLLKEINRLPNMDAAKGTIIKAFDDGMS